MKNQTTLVFVLGMHRSGTSAFTRCLNKLGATLPDNLMPASSTDNAKGYWESESIVDISNRVFGAFGLSWNSPGPMPEGWTTSNRIKEPLIDSVRVLDSLASYSSVAIKDPRISRLLPFWNMASEKVGAISKSAICVRHPLLVAGSLARRDAMETDKALILWLRHTVEAFTHSARSDRCIVVFERLLEEPVKVMKKVATKLNYSGVDWAQFGHFADEFLSCEELHAKKPSVDGVQPDLLDLALNLYRNIIDDHEDLTQYVNEVANKLGALDRIGGTFINRADAEYMAQRRQAVRLHNQVSDLKKETIEVRQSDSRLLAAISDAISPLESELSNTTLQLRETKEDISDIRRQIFSHSALNELASKEDIDKVRQHLTRQLASQTDSWNAMHRELKRALHELTGQLWSEKSLIKTIEAESARRARQDLEVARLQREVVILQTRLLGAESIATRNEERIRLIQRSLLWRLLSPIRNVSKLTKLLSRSWRQQKKEWKLVESDERFDAEWYLTNYADVRETGMPPAEHYCRYGWREGRDPGPRFSTAQYLAQNTDVEESGANPLVHFIKHGRDEGRYVLTESNG